MRGSGRFLAVLGAVAGCALILLGALRLVEQPDGSSWEGDATPAVAPGADSTRGSPEFDAHETAAAAWMVPFAATPDQPIGLEEKDLRHWIETTHRNELPLAKRAIWDRLFRELLLLQTPASKRDVPAFSLARYEVTNAQWAKFLDHRTDAYTTAAGDTLGALATRFWGLEANEGAGHAEFLRACKVILRRNEAALGPVLNPGKDPKWDFLVARADQRALPAGLRVEFTRFLPPRHWDRGEVPEHARKQPMHFLSWEQADDFCAWAGFHLPTEFEWERAARGPEGRLLPWEGDWDPLRAVWHGFNFIARKSKDLEITVRAPGVAPANAPSATPFPADVDTFPEGATPEGIHHLIGNVAEITSSRAWTYADSRCTWPYGDGSPIVVRGGSWEEQDEEFLLATDRAANSFLGARLASHAADSAGFRLASYPVVGADLTQRIADRFDPRLPASPFRRALPPAPLPRGAAPGTPLTDTPVPEFEVQRTAGMLRRELAAASPDHVWVTGPATGVAFLPVASLPASAVGSIDDLVRLGRDGDRLVVLGLLTGTRNAGIEVTADAPRWLEFGDATLFSFPVEERVRTQEFTGAVVTFDGAHLRLHRLNDTLRGPSKYREGHLGRIDAAPVLSWDASPLPPTGRVADGKVELSTSIPVVDERGSATAAIRLTFTVPFRAR